jgi:hypothetical protein
MEEWYHRDYPVRFRAMVVNLYESWSIEVNQDNYLRLSRD